MDDVSTAAAAYIWLYPLVLMEETRLRQSLAFNAFHHSRKYPPGTFRTIIRPNFDTLYSVAWLDLSTGPVVIDVPNTASRYYCMHMMDFWTDTICVPGSRTSGTDANSFVFVGPEEDIRTYSKISNVFHSPTPYVWVINRIRTDGPEDYEAVHKLQDAFHIHGLAGENKRIDIPKTIDRKTRKITPLKSVKNMTAQVFFSKALLLLNKHSPHKTDGSITLQLQRLLQMNNYNDPFQFDLLVPAKKQTLVHGCKVGQKLIRDRAAERTNLFNGWTMFVEQIGTYGNNYIQRAAIAAGGLGAVPPDDAIYTSLAKSLDSSGIYEIIFAERPPCNAFWSITLYDDKGFPVPNKWDKYALNNHHGLVFESDGSLILHVQRESPGIRREKNWLPSPKRGRFSLTGRFYAPRKEMLKLQWKSPPVQLVQPKAAGTLLSQYPEEMHTTIDEETADDIGTWLLDVRENENQIHDKDALPPVQNILDVYLILSSACKITSTLGDLVGWKCGATNKTAWTKFGLDEPFRAPLHRYRLFQQAQSDMPVEIPVVLQNGFMMLEAEFAFIIDEPLPPRSTPYSDDEIWDSIRVICPSIEVIGTRWAGEAFQSATPLQKIVDFGLNECCVIGTTGISPRSCRRDLNKVKVEISVNGVVMSTGNGSEVYGHPIQSLGWLASNLNKSGLCTSTHMYGGGGESGLLEGDFIMTGAACVLPASSVQPGDVVSAKFEDFGEVSLVLGVPKPKM